MAAPKHIARLFYQNLVACAEPSDSALEASVIGHCLAGGESMSRVAGYVVAEDFFDQANRATYERLLGAFKAAGGKPGTLGSLADEVGESAVRLRGIHARRLVQRLGWDLVWESHKGDAWGWTVDAMRRIQELAARLAESGLHGAGQPTPAINERKGSEMPAERGASPRPSAKQPKKASV